MNALDFLLSIHSSKGFSAVCALIVLVVLCAVAVVAIVVIFAVICCDICFTFFKFLILFYLHCYKYNLCYKFFYTNICTQTNVEKQINYGLDQTD